MKKTLLILIVLFGSISAIYPQTIVLSTKERKNCKVQVTKVSLVDNILNLAINPLWVMDDLKPINDFSSHICFEVADILKALPPYISFINPEGKNAISSNSVVHLKFRIEEKYLGGTLNFNFRFFYAPDKVSASYRERWEEYAFARPREVTFMFIIKENEIVNLEPPRLTVLNPIGVEEGLKPIVDSSIVRIGVVATDATGIATVTINNLLAEKVDDSTYVADVPLKPGFENSIVVSSSDTKGRNTKKQFLVECRKPISPTTTNQLASMSRKPSDVDLDIPGISKVDLTKFALIIGNEDYSTFQKTLKNESNVDYAVHDAEVFKEYAIKVLGVPEENVIMAINAKALEMHRVIDQMAVITKNLQGNATIYAFYAGHGFPDEQTREPYLMPVDVNGTDLKFAIKQSDFFKKLIEYPSKQVIVFLDACFSGGGRNQGLLAARGVKVKPKENILNGNLVVFTASSGEQSSLPYEEKQHGLFTYFLLKKLKETKGNISLKELSDYLTTEVGIRSTIINNKEQNPQTIISYDIIEKWQGWKLK